MIWLTLFINDPVLIFSRAIYDSKPNYLIMIHDAEGQSSKSNRC